MILGVDTGLATCGWALLDEERRAFVGLGVVIQPPIKGATITLDRVRRCNALAHALAARAPGCSTIVVEQLSLGMPGAIAKLSVGMAWGTINGIVAMMNPRPRLLTIHPQRWQREVLVNAGRQVDYDELSRRAATYLLANHPAAARDLKAIDPKDRDHAIDAAMIALVGALRPGRCEKVAS